MGTIKYLILIIPLVFTVLVVDAQRPPLDTDGDGIPDLTDKCPLDPETFNEFEDEDGCPDVLPKPPPPKVEINAEFIGKAILIKWKLPINVTSNTEAYKWLLQRDINGLGFVDIANGERDPNNKPIEEGQEVNFYLDKSIGKGFTYTYKIFFVSVDGRDTTESDTTTSITVGRDETILTVSEGKLLLTTRVIIPQNPTIINTLFDLPDLINPTYAQTSGLQPLVTSSLNPKSESYLFSLNPIPNPDAITECNQILEILYKKSTNAGQDFTVFATIWENQTIVRNQNLFPIIPSDKRIFNDMYIIPIEEQSIMNYDNLEVQLDIDSTIDLNPSNWRQLSIYGVKLYVPQVSLAC